MARLPRVAQNVRALVQAYQRALDRSPTATNAVAGFVLASAGDATTQMVIERRSSFDGRRCAAFAIFTAGFAGVFYTRWYRYLDQVFGTRTNPAVLAKKIAAENVIMTPFFYFPVFFFSTGAIRGKTMPQCWSTLKEQFIEVNKHSLSLWLIADVVLFGVVPLQFRPLFGISVEFLWINILSFITNRDRPSASADGPGRDDSEPMPPRVHPKVHHALEEDSGALAAQLATSSVRK